MEPTIQSSFIPKQTLTPNNVARPSSSGNGMGLFTLLSFIVLFLSLLAAGGTFAYRSYLLSHLYAPCQITSQTQTNSDILGLSGSTNKKCGLYASLEDKRRQLDGARLTRMERLDTKMKLASIIMGKHMSLSPLFDLLSTTTLKTVRYTKFGTQDGLQTLSGVASSYEDIAVQSNVLNLMPAVKNPLFSNLDLDQQGNVTFTLSFGVDPSALSYKPIITVPVVSPTSLPREDSNLPKTASSTN